LLGFDERDVRRLATLAPWIRRNIHSIIVEFYDQEFKSDDSREFLTPYAANTGRDITWLRAYLEGMLERYELASSRRASAAAPMASPIFQRLPVGRIHNEINLPVKLVIGSASLHPSNRKQRSMRQTWPPRQGIMRAGALGSCSRPECRGKALGSTSFSA